MFYFIFTVFEFHVVMLLNSIISYFSFPQKKRKMSGVWVVLIGYLLQAPFGTLKLVIMENLTLRSVVSILLIVGLFVYVIVFFEAKLWNKILFVVLLLVGAVISEVLALFMVRNEMLQDVVYDYYSPLSAKLIVFQFVFSLALQVVQMLFWRRVLSKKNLSGGYWLLFSIFPLHQVLVFQVLSINAFIDEHPIAGMVAFGGMILGIIADVVLLVFLMSLEAAKEIEYRLQAMEEDRRVEQMHYMIIEEKRETMAKIRHDLRSQLLAVDSLIAKGEQEKASEMLQSLSEHVAQTAESIYCGDTVINAIMEETEKVCESEQVRLEYDFTMLGTVDLDPVVLCSIYSNLLNNAKHAVVGSEAADKYIRVSSKTAGGFLYVKVENTLDSNSVKAKNRVSKESISDRKHYGLTILTEIAAQHEGLFEYEEKAGAFVAQIMVKMS